VQNDFPGNPGPPTLTPQQVQITEGDVLAQLGLTTARLEIALRAIGERDRIIFSASAADRCGP